MSSRAAGSGQMLPSGMQVAMGHPLGSSPSGQDMSSSAQFMGGHSPLAAGFIGQMLPLGMQVTMGHPLGSFPSGQEMSSSAQSMDGQPPGSGGATVTGFWGSGQMLPLGMQVTIGHPF